MSNKAQHCSIQKSLTHKMCVKQSMCNPNIYFHPILYLVFLVISSVVFTCFELWSWCVVLMCNSPDNFYWHAATIWQNDLLNYTLCDSYNISISVRWCVFLLGGCDISVITCFRLVTLNSIGTLSLDDQKYAVVVGCWFMKSIFDLVWHCIDYLFIIVIQWRSVWFVYRESVWIPL